MLLLNNAIIPIAAADQKEHKGSPQVCQKTTWWSPRLFWEIFCGLMRQEFLEGLSAVTSGVKLIHDFIFKKNIITAVKHGELFSCFRMTDVPWILQSTRKFCIHHFLPRSSSALYYYYAARQQSKKHIHFNASKVTKNPPVWWFQTILPRRVGQNSSTAMWETHCQLLQTLVYTSCCQEWHKKWLGLGSNHFFTALGWFR